MAAQGRLERRAPGKRLCESAFDGISLLQRIRKQQQLLLPIPTSSCAIVSAATLVRENIFLHAFRVEHEVVLLSKQEFGPSSWANFSWPILADRDCLTRKL